MSASSMKSKVEAAYFARTGLAMQDGVWDVLIDLCTGIIGEITANAKVVTGIAVSIPSTNTPGSPSTGATSAQGTIV